MFKGICHTITETNTFYSQEVIRSSLNRQLQHLEV